MPSLPEEPADQLPTATDEAEALPDVLSEQGAELLERLESGDQIEAAEFRRVMMSVERQFSGPIPPPDVLAGYKELDPGLVTRIFDMADSEAAHIRAMDKRALWLKFGERALGLLLGFSIAIAFLGAGVYLIMQDKDWSGSFLSIAGVATLAAVFVKGRDGLVEESRGHPKVQPKPDEG